MAPIRVGFIGLSVGEYNYGPGGWAVASHLPLLRSSPNYQIVALCNSSVEKAKAAKAFHKLDAKVKCYGSPESLADDPDVDLVVVSVNVRMHYALAMPALKAGKNVYVEWPLGANTAEAQEMTALAKEKGVKAIAGVQGRLDPVVLKTRELLKAGKIGSLQSSVATVTRPAMIWNNWIKGAEYVLKMEEGGNNYTISFGHFFDSFLHILGPVENLAANLKLQYTSAKVVSDGVVISEAEKNTPDQMLIIGETQSGVPVSINWRTVGASFDQPEFRWVFSGTDGELEIKGPPMAWQAGGLTLKLKNGTGEAEVVEVDEKVFGVEESVCPAPGTNVARLYEAIAADSSENIPTFESVVETHKQLDEILKSAGWA